MTLRLFASGLACLIASGCHAMGAQAQTERCVKTVFSGDTFTDCVADPKQQKVTLVLDGRDHLPLRSLRRLSQASGPNTISFAMNGGMFDDAGRPIGLLIMDGKTIRPANLNAGSGNFYLRPNGVFSLEPDGAHIRTTADFISKPDRHALFATQSGPMLVIDGHFHPAIAPDGVSRNIRNGVGIDTSGHLHFIISETPVSFGILARLFRDKLGCSNALYLDGFVSSLWDAHSGRIDDRAPLGPLIVVRN